MGDSDTFCYDLDMIRVGMDEQTAYLCLCVIICVCMCLFVFVCIVFIYKDLKVTHMALKSEGYGYDLDI